MPAGHRTSGRSDMGLERGTRGGTGYNYRRDYNGHHGVHGADSGPSEQSTYSDRESRGGRADHDSRRADHGYDHNGKYSDRSGSSQGNQAVSSSTYGNSRGGGTNGASSGSDAASQALIAGLEKRIDGVSDEMQKALRSVTGKENEKFDLIFSILIELQRRQGQLEESVRSLRAQLQGSGGGPLPPLANGVAGAASSSTGGGGSSSRPAGPQQGQFGSNSGTFVPMNGQVNGQMGQQMGAQGEMEGSSWGSGAAQSGGGGVNSPMAASQGSNVQMSSMNGQMNSFHMPMGQQYCNMVASDGSQFYPANMPGVVLVASPAGMQQMPYAMPQMMSATGHGMPGMPMQFVQDQGGDASYQPWSGGDGTEANAGPSEAPQSTRSLKGGGDATKEGSEAHDDTKPAEEQEEGQATAGPGSTTETSEESQPKAEPKTEEK